MSCPVELPRRGVRAFQTVGTGIDSVMLNVANPLPVLLPMAADLATVFAAVAISLMERGREGERERGRKGRQAGRKGDFAVVYHRGRSRITTLESQMAD